MNIAIRVTNFHHNTADKQMETHYIALPANATLHIAPTTARFLSSRFDNHVELTVYADEVPYLSYTRKNTFWFDKNRPDKLQGEQKIINIIELEHVSHDITLEERIVDGDYGNLVVKPTK